MKEVNSKNQIWWESTNSILKVGFTRSFLDILADATAWHILPGNLKLIKPKSPLFAVETNDSLISVSAPIDGKVKYWNRKAQDMPDKLVETDVVLELTTPIVLSKEQLTLLESLKKEAFEYWSKMRDSKIDIKERVIQQHRYNTLASKLDREFGIDANELASIVMKLQGTYPLGLAQALGRVQIEPNQVIQVFAGEENLGFQVNPFVRAGLGG